MDVYNFDLLPLVMNILKIYVVLQAMYLPENVGIAIGGEGEPNVYILAVRYENDRKLSSKYIIEIQEPP